MEWLQISLPVISCCNVGDLLLACAIAACGTGIFWAWWFGIKDNKKEEQK